MFAPWKKTYDQSSSVHFSRSVVSDSLWPHGRQHIKLPCPSQTSSLLKLMSMDSVMPSNHFILCHPLLPPSVIHSIRVFSNESVLCIRWQSIGVSASTSVLPMDIQDWSLLGWTGWISLQSKGLSRVFSNTTVQKHQFLSTRLYSPTLISTHDY